MVGRYAFFDVIYQHDSSMPWCRCCRCSIACFQPCGTVSGQCWAAVGLLARLLGGSYAGVWSGSFLCWGWGLAIFVLGLRLGVSCAGVMADCRSGGGGGMQGSVKRAGWQ